MRTPIANSVSDIYTMFKYFIPEVLQASKLTLFDQWASAFGKIITSHELSPEGNKMRSVQRFSRYLNLPELIKLYWLFADVKTNEVLDLDLPKRNEKTVEIEPNEYQKNIMKTFISRAEDIRSGSVEPYEDNMLKLTGDAKALALSPRLYDQDIPYEGDKLKQCAFNVAKIYHKTMSERSTQIIFSDIGTPKDGRYDVYNTLKEIIISEGVTSEHIAFVHDAKTDTQRANLFRKVRKGIVRVIIGSTSKLGTGVNVQNRICAIHHIDVPWRPMDIIQREGRAIRQGNENSEVTIFRYVTKGTFDAYLWQIIENKLIFISQVMTNKSPSRSCDEINDAILSAAEVKAIAIGDPRISEKFQVDNEISKLKIVRANYLRQMSKINDVIENGQTRIDRLKRSIHRRKDLIARLVGAEFCIDDVVYERNNESINAMIAYMLEKDHDYDLTYAGEKVEWRSG